MRSFDHIDHDFLLEILATSIHDGRFLHLIKGALTAGYLENWTYHPTLSGTPQGGIVTPPTIWRTWGTRPRSD